MGTGGSRNGAGRLGWKRKAEVSLFLDVRHIARKGLLKPGTSFSWSWTSNRGEKVGSISVRVADDAERVILSYQWTPYGSDPQSVECSLWIDRTACTYGGTRPWFLCPQCGRRGAVMYFSGRSGHYACRHCARIAYYSQSEDLISRLWRKQHKIEKRLAGGAGEWNHWQKPKGMHWKTFARLRSVIMDCEHKRNAELAAAISRMGWIF